MARSRKVICILVRVCGFGNIHMDTDRGTSGTLGADREIHARIHTHLGTSDLPATEVMADRTQS